MNRRNVEQVIAAAHGALVEGERIMELGRCWGAPMRRRVPLLFLGRHQFLLVLTDRRLLVFSRRRSRALRPSDLVLGKRYETFTLEKVRRGRPLLQLQIAAANGSRMVFEFRPGRRHLGEALVHRLEGRPAATVAAAPDAPGAPAGAPADPASPATPPRPISKRPTGSWHASTIRT